MLDIFVVDQQLKAGADTGAWLTILKSNKPLKDSEGNTVKIKVAGIRGTRGQSASRDYKDGRITNLLARRNGDSPTQAMEERRAFICARLTLDWQNIGKNGEPLPCTIENAEDLYRKIDWIAEQVDTFAAEVDDDYVASAESHLQDAEKKQSAGANGSAVSQAA